MKLNYYFSVHDLGRQRRHARPHQRLDVVGAEFKLFAHARELRDGNLRRHLVPLRDPQRADPAVEQHLRLLEERPGEDDDAGGAVADLVVLRLRQLHEELSDLMRVGPREAATSGVELKGVS